MSIDAVIAAVARDQHGLVSRRQALEAGVSSRQIAGRCGSGRWRPVFRGVFEINGSPPTYHQLVLAACLAGGAVGSHFTAARLWDLPLPRLDEVEVLTVGGRVRRPGIKHHRTRLLPPDDVTRRAGVPVTTIARTLVDVSGSVPSVALGPVVDETLRIGALRLVDLRRCFERLRRSGGSRPTRDMAEILAERATGASIGGSRRELDVARALVDAGLPPTVPQHEVHLAERTYVIDHAYPWCRIGFEFDGFESHGTWVAFHRDLNAVVGSPVPAGRSSM